MKRSPAKQVEVDLGSAGILVLTYRKPLTPTQRANAQRVMEQVASIKGPTTIVLEDGCKHSIIRREAVVTQTIAPLDGQLAKSIAASVRRTTPRNG